MKRGMLLFLSLLILSACTTSGSELSYPRIVSNEFMKQLIYENTILKNNISDMNSKINEQEEDINILLERLGEYHAIPKEKSSPYN